MSVSSTAAAGRHGTAGFVRRFGELLRTFGAALATSAILASGATGCGAGKKDGQKPPALASPEGDLDPAEVVPSGITWVVRIDGKKLRGTPLLPAVVAVVREHGGSQLFDEVRKACDFPLSGIVDQAIMFTRGGEWAMAMRPQVTAEEALDCVRKISHSTIQKEGQLIPVELPGSGLRTPRTLVAATRGGLFLIGDRSLVRAAFDAPRDPNARKRYVLDGHTVALADGALLGDIPFDARVDATRAGFSLVFRAHLSSSDVAKKGEELIVHQRELAFAKARSPLAREVLRSLRVEARGAELDINLGTDGDTTAQEKYLDVLVGLARIFLETYDKPEPTPPAAGTAPASPHVPAAPAPAPAPPAAGTMSTKP